MKFQCEKCPGYCCTHPAIEVTDADIRRLASHFGISPRVARKRYTYQYLRESRTEQILRHQKDTVYKSVCRLFDRETRRCSVYAARPSVCRKYPYGNKCGYYEWLAFERNHTGDENYVPTV
jgi:Fe-S-cluster containining protein